MKKIIAQPIKLKVKKKWCFLFETKTTTQGSALVELHFSCAGQIYVSPIVADCLIKI